MFKAMDSKTGKKFADLTLFAKSTGRLVPISKDSSERFKRDFNKNKVSDDFLNTCQKAGKLFGDEVEKDEI